MKPFEKYEFANFWCGVLGISQCSERALLQRFNQTLKFCIYDERNEPHNRLHFHAFLNEQKVASIYLDNLEVDFLSSRIKQSDKKQIIDWVKTHEKALLEIRQKENGEFEIPFLGYS
ncbi:MAG: DUF4160 domain-containing protein [Clostridia bacterium]|nr:DUF4160 domain-containing protein [Clostridia bacterium]